MYGENGQIIAGKNPNKRMHGYYGIKRSYSCGTCCNCQKQEKETYCCIAYGSINWETNGSACGLYNVAFRGIHPKLRPLIELYEGEPEETPAQETMDGQMTLF